MEEKTEFKIVIIVVSITFLLLPTFVIMSYYAINENEKDVLSSGPTIEGNVTSVKVFPGGIDEYTQITMGNITFSVVGDYPKIMPGYYYKFWISERGKVLKYEKVKK